jgi:hypothetical protein
MGGRRGGSGGEGSVGGGGGMRVFSAGGLEMKVGGGKKGSGG